MPFSHLMNNFDAGRWSFRRRALLISAFGLMNLLAVLMVWYWLMVVMPRAAEAAYDESSARLRSVELMNLQLNTKQLALRQHTFSAGLIEQIGSQKPELSYLLDLLRVIAQSNQVRLFHIRPGVADNSGLLPIEIRGQLSLTGLANFWAALRQALYDAHIQKLALIGADQSGEYGLTMVIGVGTGAYVDELYAMRTDAIPEGMPNKIDNSLPAKRPRGFIVRDEGNSVIYLSADNEGRLHRVSAR